jgi:TonB family protein
MDAVTSVLVGRSREPEGLNRMFTYSMVAHGLFIAVMLLVPKEWRGSLPADDLSAVMSISLAGAPGPQSGGMTPLGGRPIQTITTPVETPRPEPVRPPAARTPEMTMPAPGRRVETRPSPRVTTAPEEARGRTPTKGSEVRPGGSVAETGGQGATFGLTTGGGGTGAYVDTGNFCCPEYLNTLTDIVRRSWNSKQGVEGATIMRFTIERDGAISAMQVAQGSGFFALDMAAQRALVTIRQFPPLPAEFTESRLTVNLRFEYQR